MTGLLRLVWLHVDIMFVTIGVILIGFFPLGGELASQKLALKGEVRLCAIAGLVPPYAV